MLLCSHLIKDQVLLWAVANKLLGFFEVFFNVKAGDLDFALRGVYHTCQTLKSCALTSAIDSQQSETFTLLQTE